MRCNYRDVKVTVERVNPLGKILAKKKRINLWYADELFTCGSSMIKMKLS